MAPATDAEPQHVASCCTSDHSAKMIPTQWAELGSKQAMTSSCIAPDYMENETTIDNSVPVKLPEEDCNNCDDYVILSRRSTELIWAARARAAVARAGEESTRIIKDRSVAIVDCGATDTLTLLQIHATDVEEKLTIIETADGVERMHSNHKCIKTYFVKNCMGETVLITVPALFVKGLPQELIGGKSVNKMKISVILADNPDICELYPLTKGKELHYHDSIEFIGEPTDCFHLRLKKWIGPVSMQSLGLNCGIWDMFLTRILNILLYMLEKGT
jgi:hypothetical protein